MSSMNVMCKAVNDVILSMDLNVSDVDLASIEIIRQELVLFLNVRLVFFSMVKAVTVLMSFILFRLMEINHVMLALKIVESVHKVHAQCAIKVSIL